MKSGFNQSKIPSVLGRHKSTIAREIHRNAGKQGYKPRQSCLLVKKRSERCRNARKIPFEILNQAFELIKIQWSPEQFSSRLSISHESVYRHIYKDRQCGDTVWQSLRCQKKKKSAMAPGVIDADKLSGTPPSLKGLKLWVTLELADTG